MSKLTEHYRLLLGLDATGRSLTFNEIEYLKTEGRKTLGPLGYRMKDCVRFVIESPLVSGEMTGIAPVSLPKF